MSLSSPPTDACLLEVAGLSKSFKGLLAVDGYHVQLRRGEILGIIGPNGAGKTTVFNLITGSLTPTAGRVHFKGQDITNHLPYRIARQGMARTFQTIRLFHSMSALENVIVGLQMHGRAGLGETLLSLPGFVRRERSLESEALRLLDLFGLADQRHSRAHSLPFGLQRRLEIACALATRPELLLLDEPAAGMNPREKEELLALIAQIKQVFELTIVLIEHDMRVIMGICHRIQTLNYGRIIAEGSPSEIQNHPQVIEAYLGHGRIAGSLSMYST